MNNSFFWRIYSLLAASAILIAVVILLRPIISKLNVEIPPTQSPQIPTSDPNDPAINQETKIQLKTKLIGQVGQVFSVFISKDGKFLASGSNANTIRLWDLENGKPQKDLEGLGSIGALVVTPDGKLLASAGWGETGDITLWSILTGEIKQRLKGEPYNVTALAINPTGQILASGDSKSNIKTWNLSSTRELRGTLSGGHSKGISSLVISPDGTTLVSGGREGSIKVWNLNSENAPLSLQGHDLEVVSLIMTLNGQKVISAGADRTIKIWDLANNGQLLGPLTGHDNAVTSLALSSDGQTLLSGGRDGKIKVWNLSSGELLRTYQLAEYADELINIFVSSGGQTLVSGHIFSSIKIWQLP